MKYKVIIKETLSRVVEVEGRNQDEAIETVKQKYNDMEIILDSADFQNVEFDIQ